MEKTVEKRAFRKGLREIRIKDKAAVYQGIMAILGVSTTASLYNYASGKTRSLYSHEEKEIERLFAEYGVADCWGL